MKRIINVLLLGTVIVASSTTLAAEEFIKLENDKPILGTWKMYAETAALHKAKKKVNNTWTFHNNGILSSISRDPRIGADKEVKVKYSIADGVIKKQQQPGREKYEDCKVVKLEEKEMTMHCRFNYYLFSR